MAKVTYYLGAGASANAVPVVNQIREAFEAFVILLENYNLPNPLVSFYTNTTPTREFVFKQIISEIKELINVLKTNPSQTIDDYAETLFKRKEKDNLTKLKVFLSFLFINTQRDRGVDFRYNQFIYKISSSTIGIWKDVRIITWNYDYQFEHAYLDALKDPSQDLSTIQQKLRCKPHMLYDESDYSDEFSIYKLNGTTAFTPRSYSGNNLKYVHPLNIKYNGFHDYLIDELINYYYHIFFRQEIGMQPALCFAWEKNYISTPVVESAKKAIVGTEGLVIIGYSFPFVNKEIDTDILSQIDENCKIYIQDIKPDKVLEDLKDRLPSNKFNIRIIDVVDKKRGDNFYLPSIL